MPLSIIVVQDHNEGTFNIASFKEKDEADTYLSNLQNQLSSKYPEHDSIKYNNSISNNYYTDIKRTETAYNVDVTDYPELDGDIYFVATIDRRGDKRETHVAISGDEMEAKVQFNRLIDKIDDLDLGIRFDVPSAGTSYIWFNNNLDPMFEIIYDRIEPIDQKY